MSVCGVLFYLFLLFFFCCNEVRLSNANEVAAQNGRVVEEDMVPLIEAETVVMSNSRRRLGRFQICALCTCCSRAKGYCLASPCCYAINCNIPNRPFGFCSFTPKTCNCFRCHL